MVASKSSAKLTSVQRDFTFGHHDYITVLTESAIGQGNHEIKPTGFPTLDSLHSYITAAFIGCLFLWS